MHGMLDPDILTLMLLAGGIDEARIASAMPAIIEAAQEIYQSRRARSARQDLSGRGAAAGAAAEREPCWRW